MSHWGEPRNFDSENATIRLLPSVETGDVWHQEGQILRGIVGSLHLLDVRGDRKVADAMLAEAQNRYVGRRYSDWLRNG